MINSSWTEISQNDNLQDQRKLNDKEKYKFYNSEILEDKCGLKKRYICVDKNEPFKISCEQIDKKSNNVLG